MKFFMVKREGSNSTSYCHATRESAATEATRLARENIGQKFYILEATEYIQTKLPEVERVKITANKVKKSGGKK